MTPVLSILIPTLRARRTLLRRLLARLEPQLTPAVKVVAVEDKSSAERGPTIGERRQRMLETADTPFICFVDDDDLVSADYVTSILTAIGQGADVVGFRLRQYTDGDLTGLTVHSLTEKAWRTEKHEDGLYRHYRTPNHLNPVRRELAQAIGFKAKSSGEDADYSTRLYAKYGATMREVFIDRVLYEYFYRTRQPDPIVMYDEDGNLTREGMEKAIADGGSVMIGGRLCSTLEQLDA